MGIEMRRLNSDYTDVASFIKEMQQKCLKMQQEKERLNSIFKERISTVEKERDEALVSNQ